MFNLKKIIAEQKKIELKLIKQAEKEAGYKRADVLHTQKTHT